MPVFHEDAHSLAQRQAAANRRADRIMGWVVLAVAAALGVAKLAGWL